MTISIFDISATLPSGDIGPSLSMDEFGRYLQSQVKTDSEQNRNDRHALRDEMYRDGGVQYMKRVIDTVFDDPAVKEKRKKWVEHSRFNNPLKRVVNEVSTVYAEPALRTVDDDENNAKYRAVLDAVLMDEQMFQVGRLLNLHRSLLVGFRVRMNADGTRDPVLDIATPANVRVLCHPNDPSKVVAWIVKTGFAPARSLVDVPAWTLWTDHERIHLRDNFYPIASSVHEHGLGVCPWVPVTLGPPGAGFWPGEEGEDLVAAHVAIWMENVFLLKESKSATKQPVIQGDTSSVARGQSSDSETPIEIGDGTSISSVDNSMDLSMFRDTADHILESVAQGYGMSAALINHQGVQSADARELMRVPLRELRKQQQIPLRRFEASLAKTMAAVLSVDLPSMSFDPSGWRIEFGEAQTPLTGNEALDVFTKARTAGVDNTIDFMMRSRPGMTEDQAIDQMERNIKVETMRNILMRPLQQIAGSMGAETSAQPPQDAAPIDDLDQIARSVLDAVD